MQNVLKIAELIHIVAVHTALSNKIKKGCLFRVGSLEYRANV